MFNAAQFAGCRVMCPWTHTLTLLVICGSISYVQWQINLLNGDAQLCCDSYFSEYGPDITAVRNGGSKQFAVPCLA